LKTKTE